MYTFVIVMEDVYKNSNIFSITTVPSSRMGENGSWLPERYLSLTIAPAKAGCEMSPQEYMA